MRNNAEYIVDGIPFVSQILEMDVADGPTEEEALHWSRRACGIACVKMLVDGAARQRKKAVMRSTWELVKEGIEASAYCDKGWIHSGLLRLLNSYGIKGVCHRGVTLDVISAVLATGNVCIASVSVGLRGGERDGDKIIGKGGHLVLFTGVRMGNEEIMDLRCHHPSSEPSWNWKDHWVSAERVAKSFSGNMIEIDWVSVISSVNGIP